MPRSRVLPRSSKRLNARPPRLSFQRATTNVRNVLRRMNAEKANRTSVRVREAILRQTPLLVRGIFKVTGDTVQPWFRIVDPQTRKTLPDDAAFQAFARTHQLQQKCRDALVDGHLHGNGYMELEWGDDGASIEEVREATSLVDAHSIDPSTVDLELREDGRYDLVQRVFTDTVRLHPDRYHDFPNLTLRGYVHGLASVEVIYHVAMSNIKGDQSLGEVLYHSGIPREHWTWEGAEQGDIDELTAIVMDPRFERAVVTDADVESKVNNPSGVEPTPYHAWVKLSIAAVLGIPVMMLEGAQAGAVVGSETNLHQYQQDLALVRTLNLHPGLERVINGVTGLTSLDYEIQWNPFPLPDAVRAVIARDRASAFMQLLAARGGGKRLTLLAAAREAGITLDPEKDLEDAFTAALPNGLLPPVTDEESEEGAPMPEEAAPGTNGGRRRAP